VKIFLLVTGLLFFSYSQLACAARSPAAPPTVHKGTSYGSTGDREMSVLGGSGSAGDGANLSDDDGEMVDVETGVDAVVIDPSKKQKKDENPEAKLLDKNSVQADLVCLDGPVATSGTTVSGVFRAGDGKRSDPADIVVGGVDPNAPIEVDVKDEAGDGDVKEDLVDDDEPDHVPLMTELGADPMLQVYAAIDTPTPNSLKNLIFLMDRNYDDNWVARTGFKTSEDFAPEYKRYPGIKDAPFVYTLKKLLTKEHLLKDYRILCKMLLVCAGFCVVGEKIKKIKHITLLGTDRVLVMGYEGRLLRVLVELNKLHLVKFLVETGICLVKDNKNVMLYVPSIEMAQLLVDLGFKIDDDHGNIYENFLYNFKLVLRDGKKIVVRLTLEEKQALYKMTGCKCAIL